MTINKQQSRSPHHQWGEHKTLLQSVDCAKATGLINHTEAELLKLLCTNIEFGLDKPISCLPVADAAYQMDVCEETIRRATRSLKNRKLVILDMPANGHRGRYRNFVNGITLTPLIERHTELKEKRDRKYEDLCRYRSLKSEIRAARGKINRAIRDGYNLSCEAAQRWASLPGRISAQWCVEKLSALLNTCKEILAGVREHPTIICDATHTDAGQFTDTHIKPNISKYVAKKAELEPKDSAQKKAKTLTEAFDVLKAIIEKDENLANYAEEYYRRHQNPLEAATELAAEMARSVGVAYNAIEVARLRVDAGDFIGICLLVWARSNITTRQQIHKPTNWFWSMGAKSERGETNVLASLIGFRKHFIQAI